MEGRGGKGREVKASERLSEDAVVEKTNACGFVRKKSRINASTAARPYLLTLPPFFHPSSLTPSFFHPSSLTPSSFLPFSLLPYSLPLCRVTVLEVPWMQLPSTSVKHLMQV